MIGVDGIREFKLRLIGQAHIFQVGIRQCMEPDQISISAQVPDEYRGLISQEDGDGLGKLACALLQLAPRLNGLSTERDELSMMTWQDFVPIATTLIFTCSLNGEISQPRRPSTMKRSSSHFTAENCVRYFTQIQSTRAKWFTTICARIYCSGILAHLQQNL